MKRLLISICFIFLCLPAFAWNERAAEISLDYLNKLVYSKVHSFNQILYADEAEINRIKTNKNISNNEINNFATACISRNNKLLNIYKNKYFIPAYRKYLEYDNSISLNEFINSIAISEISLFYDFYGFTEANLRACEALTSR